MNHKHTFGYIIKKEQLESPTGYSGEDSTLLVASNPFPGYKGIMDKKYFYLVLEDKKRISTDDLIRIIQLVNRSLEKKFDICSSEITLYNKVYKALRIYNLDLKDIGELIEHYHMYGLRFLPNQFVNAYISQIKIFKYFELSEIRKGIYKSDASPIFKYIQIPDKLGWEDFEFLVSQAMEEQSFENCDFAIASFYSREGFDNFIRVFSRNCTSNKLIMFQEFILTAIQQNAIK